MRVAEQTLYFATTITEEQRLLRTPAGCFKSIRATNTSQTKGLLRQIMTLQSGKRGEDF